MFKKQPVWGVILVLLSGFLVWYFRVILLYLFLAMCLTFILTPIVNAISKRRIKKIRIPRIFATIVAFIVLFAVIGLFFTTLFPLINHEIQLLKNINPAELTAIFDKQIYYFESLLIENKLSNQNPGFLKPFLTQKLNIIISEDNATTLISDIFTGLSTGTIAIFSILFITFFSLKDENLLKKSLANIIPGKYYVDYISVFNQIENLLSRYFVGLLVQATIISVIVSIALIILGIQNAILVGVLVGVINVIPYIGQVIAVFVAVLLGVASNIDIINSTELLGFVITICIIVIATQTLDSFIFQPLIFSKSVKAHPLEIFLMVFVGGTIAGPFGMFLSIPIYTALKVTYKGFYRVYIKILKAENSIIKTE